MLNPTPGLGAPDASSLGSYTYATGDLVGLGVYSNSAVAGTVIDELRLGRDFVSVAPIPEPGTYGISLGLVVLGLAALKRRGRAQRSFSFTLITQTPRTTAKCGSISL